MPRRCRQSDDHCPSRSIGWQSVRPDRAYAGFGARPAEHGGASGGVGPRPLTFRERMVTPHPQVSVLMSVHNASAFLPAAIDSILAQTFSDFELIVVDDGSSDNSGVLLDQYAARDGRVRTIRRPNRGLTRSLNEAAARARGILLARMDGDDLSMPDRLARQVAHLGRHSDCVTVGGQGLFIDQDGWPVGPWRVPIEHDAIDRQHLAGFGGGIIHPAAMIRREAFERVGGYDEAIPAAQDYDLWLRLAEVGRLANLPDVVLQYRLHLLSVTSTRRAEQTQCLVEVCRRARQKRGLASLPRRSQRRYPNLARIPPATSVGEAGLARRPFRNRSKACHHGTAGSPLAIGSTPASAGGEDRLVLFGADTIRDRRFPGSGCSSRDPPAFRGRMSPIHPNSCSPFQHRRHRTADP